MVAQGAAAALRTRPLPQPTASSLVVESCFFVTSSCGALRECKQATGLAACDSRLLLSHMHYMHARLLLGLQGVVIRL